MLDSSAIVLIAVLGFALVGLLGYLSYLSAKKRREALSSFAAAHAMAYAERDDRWVEAFTGAPFGQGHSRHADNVLTGSWDNRRAVAFDYRYNTTETSTDANGHTTTHEQTHRFSVTALDTGAGFPELSVAPEGFLGRLAGRISGRDIELESEDFNRAFTVHCPDRKFASDVLHPRVMELLLADRDAAFRFQGTWVLSTHANNHTVEQLEQRFTLLDHLLDQVPEFVWREVRGDAS